MPCAARVGRLVEVLRLAVEGDLALGGREVAGDDLDQRRLAGAVVAHQPEHLAGLDREIDTLQRLDRAEMLGDALELQQRQHPPPATAVIVVLLAARRSIHTGRHGVKAGRGEAIRP